MEGKEKETFLLEACKHISQMSIAVRFTDKITRHKPRDSDKDMHTFHQMHNI